MANEEESWTPRKALRDLLPEGTSGMPNLDAWSYNDLRDLEHYLKNTSKLDMAVMLDKILRPPSKSTVASLGAITELQLYAANAAKGRRHRLLGEVDQALRFEARADSAYEALPTWARW